MTQVTLKSVYINDRNAKNEPLIDKNGNPYKKVNIESTSGNKASMFVGKFQQKDLPTIEKWKAGDTVEVIIEKNGDFYNFRLPTANDGLREDIQSLKGTVETLVSRVTALENKTLLSNPTIKDVTLEELAENGVIEDASVIPF